MDEAGLPKNQKPDLAFEKDRECCYAWTSLHLIHSFIDAFLKQVFPERVRSPGTVLGITVHADNIPADFLVEGTEKLMAMKGTVT